MAELPPGLDEMVRHTTVSDGSPALTNPMLYVLIASFRSIPFRCKDFPTIEIDFAYVDAFAHALIKPERYDVVVAPNLPDIIQTSLRTSGRDGYGCER